MGGAGEKSLLTAFLPFKAALLFNLSLLGTAKSQMQRPLSNFWRSSHVAKEGKQLNGFSSSWRSAESGSPVGTKRK